MKIHGITGDLAVDGVLSAEELQELNSSQLNDVSAVRGYWQEHGYGEPYPMIIKPTGYGKGRVIDALLHPNHEPGTALLIVGTKNILVEQNQGSLRSLVIEETGESRFSILPDTRGPVIVATWQSLRAYRKTFQKAPQVNLAIVDEVHNAGTRSRLSLLRWLNPEKVVGLTATAYRASGLFRAPEHYGFQPIGGVVDTLPDCIERKWLSPLMGLCIDTEVILPRDVMTGNAISGKKLYREMRHHPDLFASIAEEIGTRFLPSGMKTIVVVNRVLEEACVIYKQLERMGFKVGLAVNENASRTLEASYVTNGSIERYKLPASNPNSIQVLISPQVIGEGFDAPATECVVWASPTHSHLRYTQVMGRGARRCRGKSYCLVVDFVYMIEGYGYSMNFAQFFKRTEITELEGGFMYVGPDGSVGKLSIPHEFTRDARVVTIVDLEKPVIQQAGDWFSVNKLVELTNTHIPWVRKALVALKAEGEYRVAPRSGKVVLHYPPVYLERLMKIKSWPSVSKVADDMGVDGLKVRKWIDFLEDTGLLEHTIPLGQHTVVNPEIVSQIAAMKEWRSIFDLAGEHGVSNLWLFTRVAFAQEQTGRHEVYCSGKVTYYPPEVGNYLGEMKKWMTIPDIADAVGVSTNVARRGYAILCERDKGVISYSTDTNYRWFPPSVGQEIGDIIRSYKPAGDWVTMFALIKALGRFDDWINNRLDQLGIQSELRWSSRHVLLPHYPPDTAERLARVARP